MTQRRLPLVYLLLRIGGANLLGGSGTEAEAERAVSEGSGYDCHTEAGTLGSGEASACRLLGLQEPQPGRHFQLTLFPFVHLTNIY